MMDDWTVGGMMDEQKDRWTTDGRMDEWMGGWMDG